MNMGRRSLSTQPAVRSRSCRIISHLVLANLASFVLTGTAAVSAPDYGRICREVLSLGELTEAPVVRPADGFAPEDGLRPLFFDGLPWKGQPTRVFAWLGIPADVSGQVPGVVLVHGGGGTAFKEWVQRWNDAGFAAISIAVEGQTDTRVPDAPRGERWDRHAWPGPRRDGIYGDMDEPLADQWMYHAVADTVLANSLLRSMPEVDAGRVGLCGISWGGVITSTVIGIDTRFAFAIPIYGCGHLFDSANQYGEALGNSPFYQKVWDPVVRLDRATMPVQWLSWPEDKHFPMDCQATCYRATAGQRMVTLIPGMKHGHGAGWRPQDSYAFAESIVEQGRPWAKQTGARLDANIFVATFESSKPLDRAVLVSTRDRGFTGDRQWFETPARLEKRGGEWIARAEIPAETTAWFMNLKSGSLTVSSDYLENEKVK